MSGPDVRVPDPPAPSPVGDDADGGVVLRHTLLYVVARGVPGLLAFAAVAAFTRLYTPEAYGRYVLVMGWVGLVHALGFQWLRSGLVRFLPADPGRDAALRSTVALTFAAVAGATAVVGLAALAVVPAEERVWFGLGLGLLGALAWFDLNQNLAAGLQRPGRYGALTAARAALFLGLGSAAAWAGWGGVGLLLAATAAYVLPTTWAGREWSGVRRRRFDGGTLRRLRRYGVPLSASLGLTFVFGYSDRVLVGALVGVPEAGLYAAGYDLAEQSLALLIAVSTTAAFPVASAALETGGVAAARGHLRQHVVVLAALLVPASVGLVVLAPEVADVVLGAAFAPTAAVVIPWVAGATLVSGFKAAYFDFAFQLGERTRRLVGVAALAAGLNVALNVWWLPRYGLVGAAYSTFASYVVAAAASWAWGRTVFPLPFPVWDLARVVAAAAAMALALAAFPDSPSAVGLLLTVVAGAAVYAAAALLLDVLGVRTWAVRVVRERS